MDRFTPFVPGHTIQPKPDQRAKGASLSRRVREAITPDLAVDMIFEAWDVAKKRGSPKSMIQVLEVALAYGYGRPSQTIEVSNDASDILAQLLRGGGPLLPPRERDVTVLDGKSQPALTAGDDGDGDVVGFDSSGGGDGDGQGSGENGVDDE